MIKKARSKQKNAYLRAVIQTITTMAKIISFDKYPLFTYGCLTNFNSDKYYYSTDLGQIDAGLPWRKLVKYFDNKFKAQKIKAGRPRLFETRTELALLILKSVTGVSDRELMERLAQDWVYQRFAKVVLQERHDNFTILSDIRERYAKVINIKEIQSLLSEQWRDYLSQIEGILMDATVFKSNIRYPSSIELLWDSIDWLHKRIRLFSKIQNKKMLRSKYGEVEKAYKSIITQKEPRRKRLNRLINRQLRLLNKYLEYFEKLLEEFGQGENVLRPSEQKTYHTIKKVYSQRKAQQEGKKVSNLILSLYKPEVRAIYRGKRSGKWEYGEKYHLFMLGNMVWIDYISNENYNECNRLEESVRTAENYTGKKINLLAADRIYATLSNRKYLKSKKIKHNFVPLGRPIQNKLARRQQKELKQALNASRNSNMEGIFGVLKEQYYTQRVKVKDMKVERMIIFFSLISHNSKQYTRWKRSDSSQKKKVS